MSLLVLFNQSSGGVAPPPAPTGLTATAGHRQVTLTWLASVGATSYKVFRGTSSGGEVLIASGIVPTSYVDTPLQNGTTYFYYVEATGPGGDSTPSNEVSATPHGMGFGVGGLKPALRDETQRILQERRKREEEEILLIAAALSDIYD